MVEIEKLVTKLKWQVEFLNDAFPDQVQSALNAASAAIDLFDDDELLNLDAAFTWDKAAMHAFLDELIQLLPTRGEMPFLNPLVSELKSIATTLAEEIKTDVDFAVMSLDWLTARTDKVQLFNPLEAHKVSLSIKGTEPIAERIAKSGPWRQFSFDDNTLDRLNQLKIKMPNFVEVLDCVMDAVSLARRYRRPIRVTPVLIVGEPGIGKSHFADQLSGVMGIPLMRIAVDNFQIGSDIAGLSFSYSKSSPGAVFRVLTENDHISPLVILDELDKAPVNWGYGDPLSPLHNLLEPVSAKAFNDASFPMPIDASHVIWIATANDLSRIPATIKSRFEVFNVSPPNVDQFDAILKEICSGLISEYPDITFNDDVFATLNRKTPREQRQLLQRAVARAIRLGDDEVGVEHLQQVASRSTKPKTTFGYHNFVT